jgi:hypothetical protein
MESTSKPNERATTEDFEFAALDKAKNYRAGIIKEFQPLLLGHVMEVGAGIGQMTQSLLGLDSISRITCIEPDAKIAKIHRNRFPDMDLIEGTIDDVETFEKTDCIISINVLEHIEDDSGELGKYYRYLSAKNGNLCLLVPARPEIYAPIDSDFGHFRRYRKMELAKKIQQAGFSLKGIYYFNCLGYLAWFIKFRLMQSRAFQAGQVEFYDSKIFPWLHWMETRLFRPPVGQSIIAIARAE